MSTTDGNRLANISVSGSGMEAGVRDLCISASLSVSASKVSEMKLTFQDDSRLSLFRAGLFAPGASINYGDWKLTADGLTVDTNPVGPTVTVTAPSRFVTKLRKQTGEKNWGDTPVSAWAEGIAKSVGMTPLVQPGLGNREIVRQAPEDGGEAESTWDILTAIAREVGVWLFEYGSMLVFAKPSYLVNIPWSRRVWNLTWDSFGGEGNTPGLLGLPKYTDEPGSDLREKATISIVSPDADTARPGDEVNLGGKYVGKIGGRWIIESVDFPLKSLGAVVLSCQRPIDPKVEPPRTEKPTASTGGTTPRPSSAPGGNTSGSAAPAGPGVAAAVRRWQSSVQNRGIDTDGAFGAQCVDLANHYHLNVVGARSQVIANGNQWFNNAPGSLYEKFGTGAAWGEAATIGDIACWSGFYGGGYGHVAIVLEDRGRSILCMSQNPGPARPMELSKQGLQGYLRPRQVR